MLDVRRSSPTPIVIPAKAGIQFWSFKFLISNLFRIYSLVLRISLGIQYPESSICPLPLLPLVFTFLNPEQIKPALLVLFTVSKVERSLCLWCIVEGLNSPINTLNLPASLLL